MTALSVADAANFDRLAQAYTPAAAAAIAQHLSDFLPFVNNFPGTRAELSSRTSGAPLRLLCNLTVRANPNSAQTSALAVSLQFSQDYPQRVVLAQLLPPRDGQQKVKQPYPVMNPDGTIQVECLSILRGMERPYPILEVLLALTEQFDLEYPLVSANYRAPQAANVSTEAALQSMGANPNRSALIRDASEKVTIDLNEKASSYLDTREQSLKFLQRLNESNRELLKAKTLLQSHKTELEEYLPSVGGVGVLLRQLDGRQDTAQEHSNCLVAQDPLQEQALDLMADLNASDDVLRLLDDGLATEVMTCDEYVKQVSSVARDQFVSRFIFFKVMEKLGRGHLIASTSSVIATTANPMPPLDAPSVPSRLTPMEALKVEFPQADAGIIRDVLAGTHNDLNTARTRLRELF